MRESLAPAMPEAHADGTRLTGAPLALALLYLAGVVALQGLVRTLTGLDPAAARRHHHARHRRAGAAAAPRAAARD
ncbi:MAG TPA: hypothetical protein VID73_08175 [Ktedonobacterales bacterium]